MCGGVRCLDAMLEGRILDAFALNPFAAVFMPASFMVVLAAAVTGPKKFARKLERQPTDTWTRITYVTLMLLVLNWIYLLNFHSRQ